MEDTELAVEDGCYYLRELGMNVGEISKLFEISEDDVRKKCKAFAKKLKSRQIIQSEFDKKFWEDVMQEARGNEKITLVDSKGEFYHGRRVDLEKAETKDLMALFDYGKEYLNNVPPMVLESLDKNKPGYNPLSPIKQLKDGLKIVEEILSKRN
ncbi:MAG: hypothetical protein HYY67_01935 [Thaumarchaeota archaeon]|nr:hypothetical protein [Nitrososphaerota archaeon]